MTEQDAPKVAEADLDMFRVERLGYSPANRRNLADFRVLQGRVVGPARTSGQVLDLVVRDLESARFVDEVDWLGLLSVTVRWLGAAGLTVVAKDHVGNEVTYRGQLLA